MLWLSLTAVYGRAETPAPATTPPRTAGKAESRWIFDLLPRPFQRDPRLDMTVVSETTPEGKKRPTASPQKPQYFALHSGGQIVKGDESAGKSLPAAEVEKLLVGAMAENGYLPSSEAHPPSLLIVYYWGMHGILRPETAEISPDLLLRNIFDRAALVGGEKFRNQLVALSRRVAASNDATARPLGRGSDPDSVDLGAAAGATTANALADPAKQFTLDSRNDFLLNQATDDCFYVVASAFDYASIATPTKQLLWRTRMTVSARGISQTDGLPTLIAVAAPYFGKDMPEAAILSKRSLREGTVEVGVPKVVEPAEKK
jgi:hypothetical protein